MLAEHHRLEEQLSTIHASLLTAPPGKLIFTQNGTRYKCYQTDGHQKNYIPKCNLALAKQLAQKKYLTNLSDSLLREKRAIEFYLKHHDTDEKSLDNLLLDLPEYDVLLSPYFLPLSQELTEWMRAPFKQNDKHPQHLVHKTLAGTFVRSKSEALIAMVLSLNHIPYRYECALHLGDTTIFPDFTIRHPETGQYFYWEHFGMMSNPDYAQNVSSKLQLYFSNGLIPTINLITTYETNDSPLSSELVEKIVEHYFL